MSAQGLPSLKRELGGDPPPGVARLADADLAHLAAAIAAARSRQADELRAAGEQALGAIPRVLRGPVRRIVG